MNKGNGDDKKLLHNTEEVFCTRAESQPFIPRREPLRVDLLSVGRLLCVRGSFAGATRQHCTERFMYAKLIMFAQSGGSSRRGCSYILDRRAPSEPEMLKVGVICTPLHECWRISQRVRPLEVRVPASCLAGVLIRSLARSMDIMIAFQHSDIRSKGMREFCLRSGYTRSRLYLKTRPWQEAPWSTMGH